MIDTDINELRELIALLKSSGVTRFEAGALRLEFAPGPVVAASPAPMEAPPRSIPPELRSLPAEYFDPALGIDWQAQ